LNARKGASTSYSIVDSLKKGVSICVENIAKGWAKLSDGTFVSSSYIKKNTCTKKVTTASVNIRNGPSTSFNRVKTLRSGVTLCVVSTKNGWALLSDGTYVKADYLKPVPVPVPVIPKPVASTTTTTTTTTAKPAATAAPASVGSTKSSQLGLSIAQKSSPNQGSRGSWKPDVIVCHITEGSYAGAVSWLCNTQAQASCHFVVSKKGEISQLVPLDKTAWCQGISSSETAVSKSSIVRSRGVNPNLYAVGIEHEGFYSECKGCLTDAQKTASGKLIKYIGLKLKESFGVNFVFDREHIIGHCEVDPIDKPNCPGQNFPWTDVINIAKKA